MHGVLTLTQTPTSAWSEEAWRLPQRVRSIPWANVNHSPNPSLPLTQAPNPNPNPNPSPPPTQAAPHHGRPGAQGRTSHIDLRGTEPLPTLARTRMHTPYLVRVPCALYATPRTPYRKAC